MLYSLQSAFFFAKMEDTFMEHPVDSTRFAYDETAHEPKLQGEVDSLLKDPDTLGLKVAGKNNVDNVDKEILRGSVDTFVATFVTMFMFTGKKRIVILSEGDNCERDMDGTYTPFADAQYKLIKLCYEKGIEWYFVIIKNTPPSNGFSKAFVDWRERICKLDPENPNMLEHVYFGLVEKDNADLTFNLADMIWFNGTTLRAHYMMRDAHTLTTGYKHLTGLLKNVEYETIDHKDPVKSEVVVTFAKKTTLAKKQRVEE